MFPVECFQKVLLIIGEIKKSKVNLNFLGFVHNLLNLQLLNQVILFIWVKAKIDSFLRVFSWGIHGIFKQIGMFHKNVNEFPYNFHDNTCNFSLNILFFAWIDCCFCVCSLLTARFLITLSKSMKSIMMHFKSNYSKHSSCSLVQQHSQ